MHRLEGPRLNCNENNQKSCRKCLCPTCENKRCTNIKIIIFPNEERIETCIPMINCFKYKDWLTKITKRKMGIPPVYVSEPSEE